MRISLCQTLGVAAFTGAVVAVIPSLPACYFFAQLQELGRSGHMLSNTLNCTAIGSLCGAVLACTFVGSTILCVKCLSKVRFG